MAYNTGSIPSAEGKKEYTLELDGFLGVDYVHDPTRIDPRRSPNASNFIVENGKLVKRTGIISCLEGLLGDLDGDVGGRINGVHLFPEQDGTTSYLIHCGHDLFIKKKDTAPNLISYLMSGTKLSSSVLFNGNMYILDGENYFKYDGTSLTKVVGYIPTTSIGRSPQGGGQYLYPVNLLQTYRRNTFLADGTSTIYQLSDNGLDDNAITVEILNANGSFETTSAYTVDRVKGQIVFTTAPSVSPVDGWDNIKVLFSVTDSAINNPILGCTDMVTFGYNGSCDRLVVCGNKNYKNWDFISAIDDPTYFPSTMYSVVGNNNTAIIGYSKIADGRLIIHKEADGRNPTIYYREGILLSDEQLFSIKDGAVGEAPLNSKCIVSIDGTPAIASINGIFTLGIPTEESTDYIFSKRSFFIDPIFTKQPWNISDFSVRTRLFYHNKKLYFSTNTDAGANQTPSIFIANTGKLSGDEDISIPQYNWYRFDFKSDVQVIHNEITYANMGIIATWFADHLGNVCFGLDKYAEIKGFSITAEDSERFGVDPSHFGMGKERYDSYYGSYGDCHYYEYSTGVIYFNDFDIKTCWTTPLFDLGSSVYRKNIKQTNLISDPNDRESVEMNIDYLIPYSENAIESNELTGFDFWDSTMTDFPYKFPNPEIIRVKRKGKKVKLAGFRFWSRAKKICSIIKFVCTYTYGGKIKN